jgi:hypothetical protein
LFENKKGIISDAVQRVTPLDNANIVISLKNKNLPFLPLQDENSLRH